MTEAGKRLLAAANEALAFAKGEAAPGSYKVHAPPPTVDVKAIRAKMKMTQAEFGERFGFGKARIRDWEQKRTTPAKSDRTLLVTIESHPTAVLEALELHDTKANTAAEHNIAPMGRTIVHRSLTKGSHATMTTAQAARRKTTTAKTRPKMAANTSG